MKSKCVVVWKQIFNDIGVNNCLTVTELCKWLKRLDMALSMADIRELVETVDGNGDQGLTQSEFAALLRVIL